MSTKTLKTYSVPCVSVFDCKTTRPGRKSKRCAGCLSTPLYILFCDSSSPQLAHRMIREDIVDDRVGSHDFFSPRYRQMHRIWYLPFSVSLRIQWRQSVRQPEKIQSSLSFRAEPSRKSIRAPTGLEKRRRLFSGQRLPAITNIHEYNRDCRLKPIKVTHRNPPDRR